MFWDPLDYYNAFYILSTFCYKFGAKWVTCEPLVLSGLKIYLRSWFWFLSDAFYRPRKVGIVNRRRLRFQEQEFGSLYFGTSDVLYLVISRTETDKMKIVLLPVR